MRKVTIIGIGAGDPGHVTMQAVDALRATDVFFVVTKRREQDELVALRRVILDRYVEAGSYRTVELADPERRRGATAEEQRAAVLQWRAARAAQYARTLGEALGEDEAGAFLAWGDPSLYESTLTVLQSLRTTGALEFELDVIPGVSALAALTARHRIPLNRPGGAVQITTGRRLADHGLPTEADDVVVMLDPDLAFADLVGDDIDVYWGAYLGTEDELLVSGPAREVAGEIQRLRGEAKRRKGWIFDTYLLRRR